MSLSLDGLTSFIGTEFIKLLNTGTSDLATEEYVDNAVANGVGSSSVDAYTKAETDALLNNKLNVLNPDVSGNLRIQPTGGGGKLIINSTAPINASNSFFCNGSGEFNSSLKVSIFNCSSDISSGGVNTNSSNVNLANTRISLKDDAFEYEI